MLTFKVYAIDTHNNTSDNHEIVLNVVFIISFTSCCCDVPPIYSAAVARKVEVEKALLSRLEASWATDEDSEDCRSVSWT